MIAVITGFLQSAGFLWASLVFPGIWLSQALAQAIHRSLWKQRDNLFVRRPFHAWLLRRWESTKTLRLLLLCFHVRGSVIRCVVFLLHWLQSATQSSIRCILSKPVNSFCCQSMQAGRWVVSEWVRTIWTWCEALYFESRFLSLISTACLAHSSSSSSPNLYKLFCFSASALSLSFPACCRQNCDHPLPIHKGVVAGLWEHRFFICTAALSLCIIEHLDLDDGLESPLSLNCAHDWVETTVVQLNEMYWKDKDGNILHFCYCQQILWKLQNQ